MNRVSTEAQPQPFDYVAEIESLDKEISRSTNPSTIALALSKKGIAFYESGKVDEAVSSLDEAIDIAPDDFSETFLIWFTKGAVLSNASQYEEALSAYDRAVEEKPNVTISDRQSYELFDRARYVTKRPEAAIWAGRGYALLGLQRYEESLNSSNKALELDSKLLPALQNKNASLVALQVYGEAAKTSQKIVSITPEDEKAWIDHSFNLQALSKEEAAESAFKKAMNISDNPAQMWLYRGSQFESLKRTEDALAAYKEALTLAPDSEIVAEQIRRLEKQ